MRAKASSRPSTAKASGVEPQGKRASKNGKTEGHASWEKHTESCKTLASSAELQNAVKMEAQGRIGALHGLMMLLCLSVSMNLI
jgi:hypothetical protein